MSFPDAAGKQDIRGTQHAFFSMIVSEQKRNESFVHLLSEVQSIVWASGTTSAVN